MRLRVTPDGIVLSEVYSGIGIETEAGLFGIAERDGGIEIQLTRPGESQAVHLASYYPGCGPRAAPDGGDGDVV